MSDEIVQISVERAIEILPDGDEIHTFRQGGFALVGCDWERERLITAMRDHAETLQIGGEACQTMKHGLVLMDSYGPLFIECRGDLDYAELERELTATA